MYSFLVFPIRAAYILHHTIRDLCPTAAWRNVQIVKNTIMQCSATFIYRRQGKRQEMSKNEMKFIYNHDAEKYFDLRCIIFFLLWNSNLFGGLITSYVRSAREILIMDWHKKSYEKYKIVIALIYSRSFPSSISLKSPSIVHTNFTNFRKQMYHKNGKTV